VFTIRHDGKPRVGPTPQLAEAHASAGARFLRIDSPGTFSSMRWLWWTKRSRTASAKVGCPRYECQVSTGSCNAPHIVMQSLLRETLLSGHFDRYGLRIKLRGLRDAISLSVALNLPVRSFGATTDSSTSSFTDGSTRV
jgi:hypothetical protein